MIISTFKWKSSIQESEEKNSECPDVSGGPGVLGFLDYFRCHVGGCSAEGVDGGRGFRLQAESEIDQFQLLVSVQQDVLGFDVSVHDVAIM